MKYQYEIRGYIDLETFKKALNYWGDNGWRVVDIHRGHFNISVTFEKEVKE